MRRNTSHQGNGVHAADPSEALREELAAMKKELTDLFHERSRSGGSRGGSSNGVFHMPAQLVSNIAEKAKEGGAQLQKKIARTAADRPMTTIAVAAAVGAVAALLIRRAVASRD